MPHPNSRGERRALARKLDGHHEPPTSRGFEDKNWKLIFRRANKLHRARQIGKLWPYREWEKLMADARPLRLLFVCSKNRLRSPTGEAVFASVQGVETRSAGTARDAIRQVGMDDIRWCDLVICMEDKHANRLKADFRQAIAFKPIHVLGIPDDYKYMEDELVDRLRETVMPIIKQAE
ncbi:hypothetical protein WNY37_00175 [Henriciella sp. AS95]|uniref:low molecular weight protein tyrosine phosphatase family protein n=1 Tax=Henriciella sp. AS95 TaxID=3135782 RepID=UPI003175370E